MIGFFGVGFCEFDVLVVLEVSGVMVMGIDVGWGVIGVGVRLDVVVFCIRRFERLCMIFLKVWCRLGREFFVNLVF